MILYELEIKTFGLVLEFEMCALEWTKHWVRVPKCALTIEPTEIKPNHAYVTCYNTKNLEQIHWYKLFGGMYGLAVMMSISKQTTNKNIGKMLRLKRNLHIWIWQSK